jgi:hypothetical protein
MTHYTYSSSYVDDLVHKYLSLGGEIITIEEGILGYGFIILHDTCGKLKTIIIKEIYVNCWTSTHTVRKYNKTPKKYEKIIFNKLNEFDEEDEEV